MRERDRPRRPPADEPVPPAEEAGLGTPRHTRGRNLQKQRPRAPLDPETASSRMFDAPNQLNMQSQSSAADALGGTARHRVAPYHGGPATPPRTGRHARTWRAAPRALADRTHPIAPRRGMSRHRPALVPAENQHRLQTAPVLRPRQRLGRIDHKSPPPRAPEPAAYPRQRPPRIPGSSTAPPRIPQQRTALVEVACAPTAHRPPAAARSPGTAAPPTPVRARAVRRDLVRRRGSAAVVSTKTLIKTGAARNRRRRRPAPPSRHRGQHPHPPRNDNAAAEKPPTADRPMAAASAAQKRIGERQHPRKWPGSPQTRKNKPTKQGVATEESNR